MRKTGQAMVPGAGKEEADLAAHTEDATRRDFLVVAASAFAAVGGAATLWPLIQQMIETGYTGRKGKGGFYRLNREGGEKVKESVNLQTGEFARFAKNPCGKRACGLFYQLYELNHAALAPWRAVADATRLAFQNPLNPWSETTLGRSVAAAAELADLLSASARRGITALELVEGHAHGLVSLTGPGRAAPQPHPAPRDRRRTASQTATIEAAAAEPAPPAFRTASPVGGRATRRSRSGGSRAPTRWRSWSTTAR